MALNIIHSSAVLACAACDDLWSAEALLKQQMLEAVQQQHGEIAHYVGVNPPSEVLGCLEMAAPRLGA